MLRLTGGHTAGPLFFPGPRLRAPKWPQGHTRLPGIYRRGSEARATPPWVSHAEIRELHRQARELSCRTGVQHHVHHEVPLTHPLVCGLHWHGNLRVTTASENLRLGNREWPDMPEQQLTLW